MTGSILGELEELAAEFDLLGDWEERYRYVIVCSSGYSHDLSLVRRDHHLRGHSEGAHRPFGLSGRSRRLSRRVGRGVLPVLVPQSGA